MSGQALASGSVGEVVVIFYQPLGTDLQWLRAAQAETLVWWLVLFYVFLTSFQHGMCLFFSIQRGQLPSQRLIKLIANSSRNYYFDFYTAFDVTGLSFRFYKNILSGVTSTRPFFPLTSYVCWMSVKWHSIIGLYYYPSFPAPRSQWWVQGPNINLKTPSSPSFPLYYILCYTSANIMVPLSGDQVFTCVSLLEYHF